MKYLIAGHYVPRKSTIALNSLERKALESGECEVSRKVEWPLSVHKPIFEEAYIDEGGTDVWGPGPYLKVPNLQNEIDEKFVNRLFCPWGYPPDRVRVSRQKKYIELKKIVLKNKDSIWFWHLTITAVNQPDDRT